MAEALMLRPEREFIDDVMQDCGGNLKKCFQCATCSSVCTLSTEARPFPRKQVLEAQWGMGDQLTGDPAIWLCHNCRDCTIRCPRGSHPAEVMGAIRGAVIKRLAFPRFMGGLVATPQTGALMLVLSAIVLLSIAVLHMPDQTAGAAVFAAMFPKARLEALFFAVSGLVVLALAVGAARFAKALRSSGANGPILPALVPALLEVMSHRRFADCGTGQVRRWGHLSVLYGFLGLAAMGTTVGIGSMMGVMHTPLPTVHPLKIFANLCALVIAAGVALVLWNRLSDRETRASSVFFDWFFLLLLGGGALTGIFSEALRLVQYQHWMFFIYFIHLTLVLTLFLCTPYSKFVHFLYRTMAMAATWEERKLSGRELVGFDGPDVSSLEGPGLHPASS
jgi:quinone-modifying oxidoreductase subunit QmoC